MKSRILAVVAVIVVLASSYYVYTLLQEKQAEHALRLQKEQELQLRTAELADLQSALEKLNSEKSTLEKKLKETELSLENLIDASRRKEQALNDQIASLIRQNEDQKKFNADADGVLLQLRKKIEALTREKTTLESKLVELESQGGSALQKVKDPEPLKDELAAPAGPTASNALVVPVNLGKIVVQKSSSQAARVEFVNSLYGFIVLSAGYRDGLSSDMSINITRDNRFIGKAIIKQIRKDRATALLLPLWMKEDVQVGDIIRVD